MGDEVTTRTRLLRAVATVAVAAGASAVAVLLPVGAAADPTPTPSPGAATVTKAGTSFLTATPVGAGQPVRVAASTGEYLYWSFTATTGQVNHVAITVTLPPAQNRHGAATWTVDVFDGLRRRQACTAGAQSPTAAASDPRLQLGCTLRQVRSWAEPWSGDPLPGTYYVRLSVLDLPEQDLGLPVQVEMLISTLAEDDDAGPEGGKLKAPLVPATKPGSVVSAGSEASPVPAAQDADDSDDGNWFTGWLPELSTRWIWTTGGGILAAVAGVVGFGLTRRPRRR